jgi:hypothetical protein
MFARYACCSKKLDKCLWALLILWLQIPEAVTTWNVKRLGIAREKRHMDMPVMLDFYRHLDNFLTAQRSTLAF